VLDGAEIKYSTVQNWYPGNKEGKGVYNFVTKRGLPMPKSLDTSRNRICCDLKYPSCILKGDSVGEFILQ
jgi:Fe-S cluster assembly protein SufB